MHTTPKQLTKHQQHVLQALSRSAGALTAYELLDGLREDGLRAPQQVYRALDKLIEYGLVHRIESTNAFVACAHPEHAHAPAMFAICEVCGRTEEFFDGAVAKRLNGWAKDHTFKLARATVEMRGTCSACLS